ncbi:rhomboid family intramembrane serine protease [Neolewinella aurantiaca]|uniref:Rhomboid family intramembrane serine protease n=1 Tax=Neolewinella aurantiaca TaxID=2602767 RepID=A0A5C7FWQ0_9BACT|nr:rhomboid family intramembrane serine protease [Neolewinella aurantiaca]
MTYLIIGITGVVSYLAFNDSSLRAKMLFVPAMVKNRGETYRFITHGFIHADFMHLLLNMWALYIFGPFAEVSFIIMFGQTFGGAAYLLFYLAAIAASSYITYTRHQDNYGYTALGASGAVAAVMWPFIFFQPWAWFVFPPLPAIILGPAYIAYSHYADKRGTGNIGHNAHLWGAIFGLVTFVILAATFAPYILADFAGMLMQPTMPF